MKIINFSLFLFLGSCTWFHSVPSGSKAIQGSFVYYDYYSSHDVKCGVECPKEATVVYRLKSNDQRSFLVEVPVMSLVKGFFDKRESLPYNGQFEATVVYDSLNRIDYFEVKSLNNQPLNLQVKAGDTN